MPSLRFARVKSSIGPMWVAETDLGVAAATRDADLFAFLAGVRQRFGRTEPDAAARR